MNLKLILRTLLFFLSIWMCASSAYAQISLMKDGKTKAKIILAEDSQMNRVAANLFQSFFQKITGKTLPVVIKQIRLSLKPWGIALKFLFLHHENILFPND